MHKILGFIFFLSFHAYAEIIETNSMKTAVANADNDTLVIFDIDNTLIENVQTLGTDQWFDGYMAERKLALMSEGMPGPQAVVKSFTETVQLWNALAKISEVRPVEADTPKVVADLQKRGILTLGLTARNTEIISATHKQLQSKNVGIYLNKNPVMPKDFKLEPHSADVPAALFAKGILFSGDNPKGNTIVQFLKKLPKQPKKIIFVDDKKKNVVSVDEALDKSKYQHVSYRYGAADERVKNLDMKVANTQLYYFKNIMSDETAKKLGSTP